MDTELVTFWILLPGSSDSKYLRNEHSSNASQYLCPQLPKLKIQQVLFLQFFHLLFLDRFKKHPKKTSSDEIMNSI